MIGRRSTTSQLSGQPLESRMGDRAAQQLPDGFLIDGAPQVAKNLVDCLKIAIDMLIGVGPHRVKRAGGEYAAVEGGSIAGERFCNVMPNPSPENVKK